MIVGTVYLVGAGPGDPQLLTVGGKEALSIADVVVYDRLVHPAILEHAPADATLIYVGKEADRHTLTQSQINDVLSTQALLGKTVVRLKGGDPFVFGRGGEEAEHLRGLGVPYLIIPGVTSAIAAPAYAGIPVTHRDASSSFAVITGHERSEVSESSTRTGGEAEERRRWDRIASAADTLIFLMGVENLSEITSRLMENGRSPETPVALVRWGTWAGRQETLVGNLGSIAETVKRIGFKAPAVTVVGDVVAWRSRLQWWDNRPLSGKRIVVTRAREQSSGLLAQLTREGAEAIEFPTIRIIEPSDGYGDLDKTLEELPRYQWLIFTSANAVAAVTSRLSASGRDARALSGLKIASVGPATTSALAAYGIVADFQPTKFTGEEVTVEFPVDPLGLNILIPRALEGNDDLSQILRSRGADVKVVAAYETVLDGSNVMEIQARISREQVDMVTFTSSSTVKNFATALGTSMKTLDNIAIACIGPSTAQTVREVFGREPDVLAIVHTIPGLMSAVKTYFEGRQGQ
jgi:uroporphyrinogen III methyltransferase/synthase